MQADEFEKNIRDKMEEFSLVANSAVWNQVSSRIQKEKKKRRLLFYWLFSAIVSLGGISAWWIATENKAKPEVNNVVTIARRENYKRKQNSADSPLTANRRALSPVEKSLVRLKKIEMKQAFKPLLKNRNQQVASSTVANKDVAIREENELAEIDKQEQQPLKELAPHRFYNPNALPANVTKVPGLEETGKKLITKKDISQKTSAKQTSTATALANKKWKLGVTSYFGFSDNMTSTHFANNNAYYDYSPGSLGSTGNSNATSKALANFKTAGSAGIGIFISKPLTVKVSLSVGLDYHFYKANLAVGKSVSPAPSTYDSVAARLNLFNGYYNAGSSSTYSNKYHLLELPVNVGYQINKNQVKPITVSAGISPAYLVSSNALYANPMANVYYVDKQKFDHLQLSAQLGFSFPVIGSLKYLLSVGPQIQYGFTNMMKTTAGISQHLIFTGIKANITFR